MKKLTNHEKHIMMWDELARTGDREKYFTVVAKKYFTENDCYACEESEWKCKNCPIDWKATDCLSTHTVYKKWCYALTAKTRKKYAAIIRDLPWNKK
jgi:hypothetical protein